MQCVSWIDCGTLPDWIVAAIALGALWFASGQLKSMRSATDLAMADAATSAKAASQQVEIARATLLMEIDRQFESADLYRSRKAIRALRHRAQDMVEKANYKDQSAQNQQHEQAVEMSHQLDLLWSLAKQFDDVDVDNPQSKDVIAADRYTELMTLPNWIETIGLLCRRNLLPKDDILDLYDQVVIPTVKNIRLHIDKRRQEQPYPNPRFMENAYWLCCEAEAYKQKRERTVLPLPASSNLFG